MFDAIKNALNYALAQVLLPLAVTAIITLLLLRLVTIIAGKIDQRVIATAEDGDRRARMRTVHRAGRNTARVAILAIATLIALASLGINIGPALTAAGILGLTISLGAQTLIKDFIGGLTVLLEDEYRVGDTVRIGAVTGEVERITLRRTDVRDAEGRLFIVPNGDVRVVANETRDWARALVELNVGFDEDIDKALDALEGALVQVAADPRAAPFLLDKPEIIGWSGQNDQGVVIRLRARTKAGHQWEVTRVMRQHAVGAMREAGLIGRAVAE